MECQFCGKECKNKNSLAQHEVRCKSNPNCVNAHSEKWLQAMHNKRGHSFNQYTKAKELGLPKPELSEETKKKLSERFSGNGNNAKREAVRNKISASLKVAHSEGRAHNIGECRWNNKPSYREQWFMNMMENELNQKVGVDYQREYPFHKYSIDFAWPDRKICVEIDGEQHQRFQEQKFRDLQKDFYLKDEGWLEVRRSWKYICNNTKQFIAEIKSILGN